ncbi:MAG: hypothetical protein LBJ01_02820, partial [Tannerella sp.]|nr:hypothetical protein [Tannerella sp.]
QHSAAGRDGPFFTGRVSSGYDGDVSNEHVEIIPPPTPPRRDGRRTERDAADKAGGGAGG